MSIPASPRILRSASPYVADAGLPDPPSGGQIEDTDLNARADRLAWTCAGAFNLGDNPQLKLLVRSGRGHLADHRSARLDAADAAHRRAAARRQLARADRQLLARNLMPLGTIQIPFPDSTMPGTPGHFQESGGRIINSYLEPLGPAAPSTLIYRRAPGLRTFGTTIRTGFRGGIQVGGTLYTAWNNRLVTFTNAGGAAADVGALTGTAKGFFARNVRATAGPPVGPDTIFVDPDGNTAVINGVTIGTLTRPTDMGAPNSVCAMDGFFVFTVSDGKVWASDNNSVTIQALSFGTAENKPDGLIRGVPWAGQLFLFGPSTTEVWANAGTIPFPFQRSVVIPRGLAGPYCVAGFEDNFSRALVWVADDNTVVRLNGYLPEKISPPDLDGLIEREPADASGRSGHWRCPASCRAVTLSSCCRRRHGPGCLISTPTNGPSAPAICRSGRASRVACLHSTSGCAAISCRPMCRRSPIRRHTEAPGSQLVTGAVADAANPAGGNYVRLTVANARQFYSDVVVVSGVAA